MDLPVQPPIEPMLARLARTLPVDDDTYFEPTWDGLRCLAFRSGDEVDLRSRNQRPLARYSGDRRGPPGPADARLVLDGGQALPV